MCGSRAGSARVSIRRLAWRGGGDGSGARCCRLQVRPPCSQGDGVLEVAAAGVAQAGRVGAFAVPDLDQVAEGAAGVVGGGLVPVVAFGDREGFQGRGQVEGVAGEAQPPGPVPAGRAAAGTRAGRCRCRCRVGWSWRWLAWWFPPWAGLSPVGGSPAGCGPPGGGPPGSLVRRGLPRRAGWAQPWAVGCPWSSVTVRHQVVAGLPAAWVAMVRARAASMGPNAAASPGWPVRPSRVVSGMVRLIAAAGGPVPARPEGPAGAGCGGRDAVAGARRPPCGFRCPAPSAAAGPAVRPLGALLGSARWRAPYWRSLGGGAGLPRWAVSGLAGWGAVGRESWPSRASR